MIRVPSYAFAACLFALSLPFAAIPARAQGGPGHWVLQTDNNGSTDYYVSNASGLWTPTQPWNRMVEGADAVIPFSGGDIFAAISSGTAKVTVRWVDNNGMPASNPPAKVYLYAWPWASWHINTSYGVPVQNLTHSANDGNGDAEQTDPYVGIPFRGDSQPASFSNTLFSLDGSSGTAEKEYVLSAQLAFTSGVDGYAGANCYLFARVLNFNAAISSSIDPTYHRDVIGGIATQVANVPDGGGNIHADSIPFVDYTTIKYQANVSGDWSPDSHYHWYSQVKNDAASGSFSISDPPEFYQNRYTSQDNWTPERIDLHLTDKDTGYDVHTEYFFKMHDKYENWQRKPIVYHPAPYTLGQSNSEWHRLTGYDNYSATPIPDQEYRLTTTYKHTMSGKIGTEGGAEVNVPDIIKLTFKTNEEITIGQEVSTETSQTIKWNCGAWQSVELWVAQEWEERSGTCSLWGANGYMGDLPWSGDYVKNTLRAAVVTTRYLPHFNDPYSNGANPPHPHPASTSTAAP